MIRSLLAPGLYVVCVEHDLSILDYLSDYVCCLYGTPGAYGVVTMPMSCRQGINVFLAGFIPMENMRFRDVELTFRVTENETDTGILTAEDTDEKSVYKYPTMSKCFGPFTLNIDGGVFKTS